MPQGTGSAVREGEAFQGRIYLPHGGGRCRGRHRPIALSLALSHSPIAETHAHASPGRERHWDGRRLHAKWHPRPGTDCGETPRDVPQGQARPQASPACPFLSLQPPQGEKRGAIRAAASALTPHAPLQATPKSAAERKTGKATTVATCVPQLPLRRCSCAGQKPQKSAAAFHAAHGGPAAEAPFGLRQRGPRAARNTHCVRQAWLLFLPPPPPPRNSARLLQSEAEKQTVMKDNVRKQNGVLQLSSQGLNKKK
ncbi:uncharacterized protein Tco025E_02147 [Trypanosoma conorhini]|uniref:Uncharacterized protein n=1 Tax=Trypanosoma conorhini TaxID=83891 RepID=A0A422Q6X2_9TRYP|nr:uncharacterized protein Tco025E_02147 [Trypanosoma conorhini]RNF25710.1 hypothetical protein Tco025E_02147 [Trypanosoma conorhini]